MASIQYSIPSSRDRANAIYTDAMARMYGLVALGIVTTGAAIWVGDAAGVGDVIFALGWIGMLLFFGIILGTLYAAGAVVRRGNIALGIVLYLVFTGMWGLLLSPILTSVHERNDRRRLPADRRPVRNHERRRDDHEERPVEARPDADDRSHRRHYRQPHQRPAAQVGRPVPADQHRPPAPVPRAHRLGDEAHEGAGPGGRDGRGREEPRRRSRSSAASAST